MRLSRYFLPILKENPREAEIVSHRRMLRAMLRTTVVSLLIFGALYVLTKVVGLGIDDIPRFMPEYN